MPRYLCLPCRSPRGSAHEHIHDGALVDADSPQEAAAQARELMETESVEEPEASFYENMFTLEVDPEQFVCWQAAARYERVPDEWQCCGGPCQFIDDGHYVGCPKHVRSTREANAARKLDEAAERLDDPA